MVAEAGHAWAGPMRPAGPIRGIASKHRAVAGPVAGHDSSRVARGMRLPTPRSLPGDVHQRPAPRPGVGACTAGYSARTTRGAGTRRGDPDESEKTYRGRAVHPDGAGPRGPPRRVPRPGARPGAGPGVGRPRDRDGRARDDAGRLRRTRRVRARYADGPAP